MQTTTIGWVAAVAMIVGALVKLTKSDMLTIALANLGIPPIPKRILPWLALTLGLASSVLDHRLQGTAWIEAVTKGAIAAITAIAGHELGVESLRKGKELLIIALLVTFGATTTSCALFTKENAKSVMSASEMICIFNSTILEEDKLADVCGVTKELLPILRNLIGQREGAKRAGVHWPSADGGASTDAGADGSR